MDPLTSRERITRILKREPVDRISIFEAFSLETVRKWQEGGHLQKGESPLDHFNLDIRDVGSFNLVADLDFREKIVEEAEETKLVCTGNGALL